MNDWRADGAVNVKATATAPAATVVICIVLATCVASEGAAVYPLKKSANGRYLADQNNVPFLIVGDSPQALMVNLTTNDAGLFFTDRSTLGFNTVWINLLCSTYTGGRADSSTLDGIVPFTARLPSSSSYDLTKTNEAYFE